MMSVICVDALNVCRQICVRVSVDVCNSTHCAVALARRQRSMASASERAHIDKCKQTRLQAYKQSIIKSYHADGSTFFAL